MPTCGAVVLNLGIWIPQKINRRGLERINRLEKERKTKLLPCKVITFRPCKEPCTFSHYVSLFFPVTLTICVSISHLSPFSLHPILSVFRPRLQPGSHPKVGVNIYNNYWGQRSGSALSDFSNSGIGREGPPLDPCRCNTLTLHCLHCFLQTLKLLLLLNYARWLFCISSCMAHKDRLSLLGAH